MEDYSKNSVFLINLSQSVGRLALASKEMTKFAGYTARVSEMLEIIEDIKNGRQD